MAAMFPPRMQRVLAFLAAFLCLSMACLAGLLFSASWSDLAFRGRDSIQAPDAIFAMRFYGGVGVALLALAIFALWKGVRS